MKFDRCPRIFLLKRDAPIEHISLSITALPVSPRPSPENWLVRCTTRDVISPILRCRLERPPIWKRSIQLTVAARCNGAMQLYVGSLYVEIVDSNRRERSHSRRKGWRSGTEVSSVGGWPELGLVERVGEDTIDDREGCVREGRRGDAQAGRRWGWLTHDRFDLRRVVQSIALKLRPTPVASTWNVSPYTLTPRTSERGGRRRGDGRPAVGLFHPPILFPLAKSAVLRATLCPIQTLQFSPSPF